MSNIEIQFSSKSNEWYTPSRYIEAVRETLGFIDLDPASCLEANNLIKAKRFFSLENDEFPGGELHVRVTDEGLVFDIWQEGECIRSGYMFVEDIVNYTH